MWTFTDILQWIVLIGVAIACGDVRTRFAEYVEKHKNDINYVHAVKFSDMLEDMGVLQGGRQAIKQLADEIKAHGKHLDE